MTGLFSKKKPNPDEMSFFEHLEDLRFTIIRSALGILIFAVLAFLFKEIIFNMIILGPQKPDFITNQFLCHLGTIIGSDAICINQNDIEIINIEIAGQFKAHLLISIIAGFVLGMPVVLREIWNFVKPALNPGEQKGYYFSLFMSSILFFIGVAFGYFVLSPITIDFLSNYVLDSTIENQIRLGSYVRIVSMLCLATGIVFEMPLIIIFLTANRIITTKLLRKYRKHVIIFFLIISAIITPPDVISQFLVAFPMYLLYEISIRIARVMERKIEKN
ncbi:MAG: twin-arginine translocase subunit TatC, partial [Bacteroidota bacterium]